MIQRFNDDDGKSDQDFSYLKFMVNSLIDERK